MNCLACRSGGVLGLANLQEGCREAGERNDDTYGSKPFADLPALANTEIRSESTPDYQDGYTG